jgi:hypothetical protein
MKCLDCPDLADPISRMVGEMPARASCCIGDLVDRRAAGEHIDFTTPEAARKMSDERLANLSRQARRYEERKGRQ